MIILYPSTFSRSIIMGTTTDPMMPNLTPRLGPCFRKLIENLESARKHKKVEEYHFQNITQLKNEYSDRM